MYFYLVSLLEHFVKTTLSVDLKNTNKMKGTLVVCLLVLASGFSLAKKIRYDGYKVFRVTPKSEHHLQMLHELKRAGVK